MLGICFRQEISIKKALGLPFSCMLYWNEIGLNSWKVSSPSIYYVMLLVPLPGPCWHPSYECGSWGTSWAEGIHIYEEKMRTVSSRSGESLFHALAKEGILFTPQTTVTLTPGPWAAWSPWLKGCGPEQVGSSQTNTVLTARSNSLWKYYSEEDTSAHCWTLSAVKCVPWFEEMMLRYPNWYTIFCPGSFVL